MSGEFEPEKHRNITKYQDLQHQSFRPLKSQNSDLFVTRRKDCRIRLKEKPRSTEDEIS
jgi:hypothetical protein